MQATTTTENYQSRLLTYEENQQIFRLLTPASQSLVTTVVQLYETEAPGFSEWVRRDAGVLCLVKDNQRRNYFFQFFCTKRNRMLWQQELYIRMEYVAASSYLQMFEGDKCVVCFNFANEDEAKLMKTMVDSKLMMIRRKLERRQRNIKTENSPRNNHHHAEAFNTTMADVQMSTKGKRRRNLTKADIGNPLQFRHLTHVGWDHEKGFAVRTDDSALTELLTKAGVSESQLKDKTTRDFIYDFINKNDTAGIIQNEQVKARRPPPAVPPPPNISNSQPNSVVTSPPTSTAPTGLPGPPVPPRGGGRSTHNRVPPPPPPSVTHATPPTNTQGNVPPPRPPTTPKMMMNSTKTVPPPPPSTAPVPPPPPPMQQFTSPPPPPIPNCTIPTSMDSSGGGDSNRSAFLESIRNGTTLRPVVPDADKRVEDARGDLLSEIRKGFQLKPANEREVKPISPATDQHQHNGVNDLAAALSRALAERNRAIQPDDDSESSDSNDDWDE